uniref:Uncharacterized protein n=1 Tax=Arundo donax TaxID=35708 RepID=A0A0A9EE38_ARUDO
MRPLAVLVVLVDDATLEILCGFSTTFPFVTTAGLTLLHRMLFEAGLASPSGSVPSGSSLCTRTFAHWHHSPVCILEYCHGIVLSKSLLSFWICIFQNPSFISP